MRQPKRHTPLERKKVIQVQAQFDLFFKLYYAGRSKQHIAMKLGTSIPLLENAFPSVNFGQRGNIRPHWCSKKHWKAQLAKKAEENKNE